MNKKFNISDLTEAEIAALKREHGELIVVTIEEEGDWVFKKPDMNTLSASAALAERDPMGSALVYFNNCLVKGDPSAATNVDLWITIAPHLQKLIEEKKSSVKKL